MSRILAFTAKDNTDLGHQLGEHFRDRAQAMLEKMRHPKWDREVKQGLRHWASTKRFFPHLTEEVVAYARAAGIRWQDLWVMGGLEPGMNLDRCTTMVTNGGKLLGQNEDFDPDTTHALYLIRKTIKKLTVLDFNYFYTLGGNSVSVNSHGWAQMIDTVHGPTSLHGVPRNVIARWLSETKDPEHDARRLKRIPCMNGYSHTFVRASDGQTLNLEVAAWGQQLSKPRAPFVHTNHYLSSLVDEETFVSASSGNRYEVACRRLKSRMTVDGMKRLMSDRSRGKANSVFNEDTIGKMILDFKKRECHVWFKAEPRKGYAVVPIDFLG
jgi:hypothetical protein